MPTLRRTRKSSARKSTMSRGAVRKAIVQPYTLQLKLQRGLGTSQKKAIIDKASMVTSGRVRPLFCESNDAELETYYIVDVPKASLLKKAVAQLKGTKGIEVISIPASRQLRSTTTA